MSKSKLSYVLMIAVMIIFLLYIAFTVLYQDPDASVFLGWKADLNHPLNLPIWLTTMRVHVVFAAIGMIAGAVNFSRATRTRYPRFHRWNGYTYFASVMIVGLTSGYMAPYATGGRSVSIAFNQLNMLWPAFTLISIIQIRKGRVESHRKWMVRSYAFCFTNMAIHLLTYTIRTLSDWPYAASYRISVFVSIPLLYLAAELVNRSVFRKKGRAFE